MFLQFYHIPLNLIAISTLLRLCYYSMLENTNHVLLGQHARLVRNLATFLTATIEVSQEQTFHIQTAILITCLHRRQCQRQGHLAKCI